MGKPKVLVIDDDDAIRHSLAIALKLNGFETGLAATLKEASVAIEKLEAQLVLLDLDLPDGHGYELLDQIRQEYKNLPVIIMTASLDESSALKGLEMGAQDYVRKPFGVKELVARVWRTLDRPVVVNQSLVVGNLSLNVSQRVLGFEEQVSKLTKRQTEILELMMARPEQVVTRELILDHFRDQGDLLDRSIDAHIHHIRKKIEGLCGTKVKLTTVYGCGYKIECE